MKILRLIDSMDLRDGGPPAGVSQLDQEMRRRGHEVSCLYMRRRGEILPPTHPETQSFPRINVGSRGLSFGLLRRALAESANADVVVMHGFYLWHNIVGWCVAKRRGIPLVLQPHGVFEAYQRQHSVVSKSVFDAVIGKRVRRAVSAVLVASEAESVGARHMVPGAAIAVVGIGVRLGDRPSRTRTPGVPLRLLVLSRIAPKKRVDVSIRAAQRVAEQGTDCILSIAGDGDADLVRSLRTVASACSSPGVQFSFEGHVNAEEKMRLLEETAVLLAPSENENFAVSVAEAMAQGVPVVVTPTVAMSEIVLRRGGGRVVPSPDPELVARAVLELVSDDEQYQAAAEQAWEAIRSELLWDSVAKRWEDALRAIQTGGPSRT